MVAIALVTGSGSDAGVTGHGGPKPQRESADSSRPPSELDVVGSMNERLAWLSALRALRFPRPGGASIVTYSYVQP
jgi:hypothetical protein